jgi:hypothetical protein
MHCKVVQPINPSYAAVCHALGIAAKCGEILRPQAKAQKLDR